MSERAWGRRNWVVLAVVIGLLVAGDLALAQFGEGEGPRWAREDAGDWTPGTPGPPPWAGGPEEGDGPPWTREGFESWTPGTPGPPPWAEGKGPPWTREGAEDWKPGGGPPPSAPGPPPWADPDDDD